MLSAKQMLSQVLNVALVVVALAIAYTTYQNTQHMQQIATAIEASAPPTIGHGDVLPDVELVNVRGEEETSLWRVSAGARLIGFITTTCQYCEQTLDQWEFLSAELADVGIAVALVSLHDRTRTLSYADTHGITLDVFAPTVNADLNSLEIPAIPFTILVGEEGAVEHVWRGAFDGSAARNIASTVRQALASQ